MLPKDESRSGSLDTQPPSTLGGPLVFFILEMITT